MPEISIIIPTFNAEYSLRRCLQSITKQKFADYELIIVDDGSTDNTSSICKSFSEIDQRIKYFRKQNGGPFKARIFGVENALGKYVTFCDADDYYINNTAFNHIHHYINSYNPEAIQFGYRRQFNHLFQIVSSVKKTIEKDKKTFSEEDYPILICSFYDNSLLTTNVWNKVYQRKILQNLPRSEFAENVFWGDDLIFNLYALENCTSMLFVPDILYVYKDSIGGTTQFSKKAMNDLEIIKEHQLVFLDKAITNDKNTLKSTLFSETACWFAAWVKEAVNHIDEGELADIINKTLESQAFKKARNYYLYENRLNWEAMELLRQGSAEIYINWAENSKRNDINLKDRLKKLYKTI